MAQNMGFSYNDKRNIKLIRLYWCWQQATEHMIKVILTLLIGLIWASLFGQENGLEYCVEMTPPTEAQYFPLIEGDTYNASMIENGELLSMFGESPLLSTDRVIFRSIKFGPFKKLEDISIITIEKDHDAILLTLKMILRIKDSSVYVLQRYLEPKKWNEFSALADSLFSAEPSIRPRNQSESVVFDGSNDVYEGNINGNYHFVLRHAMTSNEPLYLLRKFLWDLIEPVYGINCRKYLRNKGD